VKSISLIYCFYSSPLPFRIQLNIEGYKITGIEKSGQLFGNGPDDVDPVWNDDLILTKNDLRKMELPGTSISVVKLKTITN